MVIRLVIFDADKTLWSNPDVSKLTFPFSLVNSDVVSDAKGETIRLFDGIRELLSILTRRNIVIALASWNRPRPVQEALRLFQIRRFFRVVKAEYHPNKHLMIGDILSESLRQGLQLRSDEVLYIDDNRRHIDDVRKSVGPIHFIHMWVDVDSPNAILEHVDKLEKHGGESG